MSEERVEAEAQPAEVDELDALDDLLGIDPDEPVEEPEEQPEQQEAEKPAQPSRATRRIQATVARQKELEAENRRLRDAILQNRPQVPQHPQVDPYQQAQAQRLEEERVAQMMPHEVAQYYAHKAQREMQGQLVSAEVRVGDYLDRQAFREICREEPLAERFKDQVEDLLARARQQGQNLTREVIYNQLLANEVRSKRTKSAVTQARKQGQRAIARETVQPGMARSTATPARRGQADDNSYAAVVARLKNVTVGEVW